MTLDSSTSFEKSTELGATAPTLIEGIPGLGLVAAIVVDQITEQLELDQHGTIVSDEFPPVAAFDEGRVRDAVRVYAGEAPAVMTLQSDVPSLPAAVDALSRCVLNDLSAEFEQAIFLAGASAESGSEIGEVDSHPPVIHHKLFSQLLELSIGGCTPWLDPRINGSRRAPLKTDWNGTSAS